MTIQPVGMVIVALRHGLLVQTDHIQSKLLHRLQVEQERCITWRSILTIRPPGLIQDAGEEAILSVNAGAVHTTMIAAERDSHSCR